MSVVCPECNGVAEKVYPEAKEMEISSITDIMLQFDKLKMYQCIKCSHVFELSHLDIIKIFSKVKGGIDLSDLRDIMFEAKDKLEKGDSKDE